MRIHIYSIFLIYISNFDLISTIGDINSTEAELCMNILPKSSSDCTNSYSFSSIACCFYNMTMPNRGNLCVSTSITSYGIKGNVNRTLPVELRIQGYFTCGVGDENIFKRRQTYYTGLVIFLFFILFL
jgi:hypothetical protein